jgi:hypothetical protein
MEEGRIGNDVAQSIQKLPRARHVRYEYSHVWRKTRFKVMISMKKYPYPYLPRTYSYSSPSK